MAGHWRGTGQPSARERRIAEHHQRVRSAPTGRAQVAAAFDRWRSAAVRDGDAEALLHEMATYLDAQSQRLERRARVHAA